MRNISRSSKHSKDKGTPDHRTAHTNARIPTPIRNESRVRSRMSRREIARHTLGTRISPGLSDFSREHRLCYASAESARLIALSNICPVCYVRTIAPTVYDLGAKNSVPSPCSHFRRIPLAEEPRRQGGPATRPASSLARRPHARDVLASSSTRESRSHRGLC